MTEPDNDYARVRDLNLVDLDLERRARTALTAATTGHPTTHRPRLIPAPPGWRQAVTAQITHHRPA